MTKKIFRSILLTSCVVLLTSLVVVMSGLYGYFSRQQNRLLLQELSLAAEGVEQGGLAYLKGVTGGEYRLTWVAQDGQVLYDTQALEETMENHGGREEIREAMETGGGSSSRISATMTRRTVYHARRLVDKTVLRISTDQVTVLALLLWMFQPILLLLVIAAVVSGVLASRLSQKITAPLNALDLDDPLSNDIYEELSPLLRRIHRQNEQIKEQLQALRARSDELTQITAGMNEAMALLNEKGMILHLNPAAQTLFRTGRSWEGHDFLELDRKAEMGRAIQTALATGYGELREIRDGREYQFDVSRVESGGNVIGVVVLAFDVTEKAAAERTRREFTANVSHELKTPLQSILGSAELLENGTVAPEDIPRFVGRIRTEAQRLVALIEDILRLSQLDEGADMPREEVELLALAQEVCASLEPQAALKSVAIAVTGEAATVRGVKALLHEIVYNLCDNAIKYNMEGGSVEMDVSKTGQNALLTVRDTGIGIPPEYQQRVFERFFRVDKSRSKQSGGTGLGLAIVKHAVQCHNGHISLEGAPGQGTIVTVTLPTAQPDPK